MNTTLTQTLLLDSVCTVGQYSPHGRPLARQSRTVSLNVRVILHGRDPLSPPGCPSVMACTTGLISVLSFHGI